MTIAELLLSVNASCVHILVFDHCERIGWMCGIFAVANNNAITCDILSRLGGGGRRFRHNLHVASVRESLRFEILAGPGHVQRNSILLWDA